MKLALDHHYPRVIAQRLRDRGHDAVAAIEAGWEGEDDDGLLALCAEESRTLLTNNVPDFVSIARRWQAEGRTHSGLIFTSDRSWPRTKDNIGRYVDALHLVLNENPETEAFRDRVHWL